MVVSVIEVVISVKSVKNALEAEVSFCTGESSESVSYLLLTVFILSELSLTISELLLAVLVLLVSVSKLSFTVS